MSGWAIETLVTTTLLMAFVLAIRGPVRRMFGPGVAYMLWLLPLIRMVLPPLPQAMRGGGDPVIAIVPEDLTFYLGEPVGTLYVAPEAGLGWPIWAAAIWIGGATLFIGWHVVAHSRFRAQLLKSARRTVGIAEGRVAMIESDAASGPMAFGVLRRYVAFPVDFAERYDETERQLALAHELGHHARGDLMANWAALVMLGLHWFNPVAWAAYRAFRADQEIACDAMVLAGRNPALRHAYGRAIVKAAQPGTVSATCHLHGIEEIKGRLRMLASHTKPSVAQRRGGAMAIGALTLAGLALTASGTGAAEELKANVAERTGVDIDRIELSRLAEPVRVDDVPTDVDVPVAIVQRTRHGDVIVRKVRRRDEMTAEQLAELDRAKAAADVARVRADAAQMEADRALAKMPVIKSSRCGGDGPATVEMTRHDGRQRIAICTDRIEKVAAAGARAHAAAAGIEIAALASARAARASARTGIAIARRSVEADTAISPERRAHILEGLSEATSELGHVVDDH